MPKEENKRKSGLLDSDTTSPAGSGKMQRPQSASSSAHLLAIAKADVPELKSPVGFVLLFLCKCAASDLVGY